MHKAYVRQTNDWTCGPACAAMLLGKSSKDVASIARQTGTHPSRGTRRDALIRFLRSKKLTCSVTSMGTIAQLRAMADHNIPVLVNYIEPSEDVGHFAIVDAVSASHLTLRDPWNGANFRIAVPSFKRRWLGYKTGHPRGGWMVSVTPKATSRRSAAQAAGKQQRR